MNDTSDDTGKPNPPGRDEKGRWQPGSPSPNPKGRPRKQPPKLPTIDRTDPLSFGQEMLEVPINGELQLASRQELINRRLFERGMKDSVHAAIYLDRKFTAAADRRAYIIATTLQLIRALRENPAAFTAFDEQRLEMGLAYFERIMHPPIPAELQQQLDKEFDEQVRAKQAAKARSKVEEGDKE